MTRSAKFAALLAVPSSLASVPAAADTVVQDFLFGDRLEPLTDAIIAERPGFSTSPNALPVGRFQVEAGFEWLHEDTGFGDFDVVTLPLALGRVGLVENVELRVGWAGVRTIDGDGDTADPTFGLKWQVKDGGIGKLSAAVLADISTDGDFIGGGAWTLPIDRDVGLFGTATLGVIDAGDSFFQFTNAVGASLALNERLGVFGEYFAALNSDGRSDSHVFDTGVTYLLGPNLVVDATAGFGINDAAADLFIGGGVAYRW